MRESRANKLTKVCTPEVHARQRAELNSDEERALDAFVRAARGTAAPCQHSHGSPPTVSVAWKFWASVQ